MTVQYLWFKSRFVSLKDNEKGILKVKVFANPLTHQMWVKINVITVTVGGSVIKRWTHSVVVESNFGTPTKLQSQWPVLGAGSPETMTSVHEYLLFLSICVHYALCTRVLEIMKRKSEAHIACFISLKQLCQSQCCMTKMYRQEGG